MKSLILAASALALVASAAVPVSASAYTTRCESKKHDNRVAGTVVGGVLGALAGNAIGRGGGRTGGTIIGAGVGAVAGNQIARSGEQHCDDGYVSRQYDDRYYDTSANHYRDGYDDNRCYWQEQSYRDDEGRLVERQVQVCR